MRSPGVRMNYIHQRQKQIKGSGWLEVALSGILCFRSFPSPLGPLTMPPPRELGERHPLRGTHPF